MKTVNKAAATAFKASMKKAPAKKAVVAAVESANRLAPVVAKTEDAVMAAAFDGVRRRPVVAVNEKGELVVCCRRTAAKNGWALEGTLFARNRTGKVLIDSKGKLVLAPESKRAAALKAPTRRTTDSDHKLVPKKIVAKLAKTVKEILA